MSLMSAVERDNVRRTTPDKQDGSGAARSESAGSGPSNTDKPPTTAVDAIKLITTYIPTEIVTLYVGYRAVIHNPDSTKYAFSDEWTGYFIFLGVTPVVAWLLAALQCRSDAPQADLSKLLWSPREWPWWPIITGIIAYTAWAAALPESPFVKDGWVTADMAGYLVLVVTVAFGLLAGLFLSKPKS